jgi:23S rRNA (uracil1939-C5)-methyltransferase
VDTYILRIDKIASGGAGMGRIGGKIVFVPRTLPGEEVRVHITREKKDYAEARPLEILVPSPGRKTPECPLFGLCGGCNLQHADYATQKEIKIHMVRETFRRLGRFDIGEIPFEESAPFAYRSRVQLHRLPAAAARASGGQGNTAAENAAWGFKKAGGGELVAAPGCPVAVAEINAFLASPDKKAQGARIQVFGWNGQTAFGADGQIRLELCGKPLFFSPECFFQANIPLLEKLARTAFAGLDGERALDLYAGVGTFGVFLEERFRRVVSVEKNPASAAWARRNLDSRKTKTFRAAVEDWITSDRYGAAAAKTPDLIVLDPPRAGLTAPVRTFLKKTGAPLILYVSCDAASLARDSAFLLENGYALAEYRLFDFYPQTAHVESLCRFIRKP